MVDELLARGLVHEVGVSQGERGRPRRLLQITADRIRTVAVRLFPTTMAGEVRDFAGDVVWFRSRPHEVEVGDAVGYRDAITAMITDARKEAGTMMATWTAPVVMVPGLVRSDSTVAAALTLGLRDANLVPKLTNDLIGPARLINGGKLGAVAEYSAVVDTVRPSAMAYIVSAESGIGGGLMVGGELYEGAHGMAGEMGHICVTMDGPSCPCGGRGCLELYLGVEALRSRLALNETSHDAFIAEVIARLELGEPTARAALETGAQALAAAVATMSNYTDVDSVVLGGDLARLYPWLKPRVSELLSSRASVVPEFGPQITLAQLEEDGPFRGAWLQAAAAVIQNPTIIPPL
ncbi:ROK family protein [Microbacterium sp. P05]|uniref:ROK family protein n=1 Tax=Microbacterium sp. P05 TaxID=3366948 RepID=UPI003744E0BB